MLTADAPVRAAAPTRAPMTGELTVLVPTRNERDNIRPVLDRLSALPLPGLAVLFVDDSSDDTPDVIAAAASEYEMTVDVLHRAGPERVGGLGGAVQAGLRAIGTEYVCVMDGDLQHPPEVIPALLERARRSEADVVIASRFCAGAELGRFSSSRRWVSRLLIGLARVLFPRRIGRLSDPLSGFFLARRSRLSLDELRPNGFKVLLEILLGGPALACDEVPFHFDTRSAGDSKAGTREVGRYLALLLRHRLRIGRLGWSDPTSGGAPSAATAADVS